VHSHANEQPRRRHARALTAAEPREAGDTIAG
jgi:hypothetical protein